MSEDDDSDDDALRRLVNAAGYLFQLRIEDAIRNSGTEWAVVSTEHQWVDPDTQEARYIDLVLQGGAYMRVVIEAKRQEAARLVFLTPEPRDREPRRETLRAKVLWTHRQSGRPDLLAFDDLRIAPATPESAFCIADTKTKTKGDERQLERTAGGLLRSVESLAEHELRPAIPEHLAIYLPVIVTTAALFTCRLDPAKVQLEDGTLSGGEFDPVGAVRFRKTLPSRVGSYSYEPVKSFWKGNELAERTVFVVSAAHLIEFLKALGVMGSPSDTNTPWHRLRNSGRTGT